MSDKNNTNFYITNTEYPGKIINLIQIITFFQIYIYKANPPFKVTKNCTQQQTRKQRAIMEWEI
jgi:hypothetical protein